MEKRLLQIVLIIVGLILVAASLLGILGGVESAFYGVDNRAYHAVLDSNLRFFSGTWLGIGLVLLWKIPSVEREAPFLRLLSVSIFLGGVGRILSMFVVGKPGWLFLVFTLMELLFPLLLILQRRIAVPPIDGC